MPALPLVLLPLVACGAEGRATVEGTGAGLGAQCDTAQTDGFAASLASETGGAASPVEAAEAFVRTGSIWSSPMTGWSLVEREGAAATVSSSDSHLHVIQGPDATWQVDSGYRCQ